MGAAGPGGLEEGGSGAQSPEEGRASVVTLFSAAAELGLRLCIGCVPRIPVLCVSFSFSVFIFLFLGGGANFRSGWGTKAASLWLLPPPHPV